MAINAALFALTLVSTLIAGAMMQGHDFLTGFITSFPGGLLAGMLKGVTFSLPLMAILGAHELAHYYNAKKHGIVATLPYFIPFPNLFGTLGAVIKIKSPILDRRALIDIGASGPLAGFILSVLACSVGLGMSEPIGQAAFETQEVMLGPSLLFVWLMKIFLPAGHAVSGVDLHPIAVAGWVGLFVTSINLMPVGQLDGGHISYAFLGRRHRYLSIGFIVILALMGVFFFPGWLLWAALLLVIGLRHPPVFDHHTDIGPERILTGIVSLAIFIVTFAPIPVVINL